MRIKWLVLIVLMMLICSTAGADMYSKIDEEAAIATKPLIQLIVGGLKERGEEIISTGARAIMDPDDIKYLAWIETDAGYYYYEMTIKMVNGNEVLRKKYGL